MPKEHFSREELVDFYNNQRRSVMGDQGELKRRFFDPNNDKVIDVNDPDMNQLVGKIDGQLGMLANLAYFIEQEPIPDNIEDIDKA